MSDKLPDSDALRQMLAGATPGPWWPSRNHEPTSVDRGKVWAFRPGSLPVQYYVIVAANVQVEDMPYEGNARLAAIAPALAEEVIRLRGEVKSLEYTLREVTEERERLAWVAAPDRALDIHIQYCEQCGGPNDGCDLGQSLEAQAHAGGWR